jgi:hypothetical protein
METTRVPAGAVSSWRGHVRTTIRATCQCCGDVELNVEQLVVRVDAPTDSTAYAFRCPACGQASDHPVSRRIADLLVSSGARLELVDPRDRHGDVELDVARFAEWLASDTWFAELLAGS